MLSKKERLTRTEFSRSFSVGKRHHSPLVQLVLQKTSSFHGSVVVGKKVYAKAVDRNKLRRRIYSILYTHAQQGLFPYTCIVIAKPPAKDASYAVLKETLNKLLTEGS